MGLPSTANDLSQFIYCCRWMSGAILAFSTRVAPLNGIIYSAFAKSGKHTKRSLGGISLCSLSRGTVHEQ